MHISEKQVPGKEHTFVAVNGKTETGTLPALRGQSNSFAFWVKDEACINGGYWRSQLYLTQRRKDWSTGKNGLLGRMRNLMNSQKQQAQRNGHKPPLVTAEQMSSMWVSQNGLCAACGGQLSLLGAAFDHNHETGEPRGFLHQYCNIAEGCTTRMTEEEFRKFVEFIGSIKMKHDKAYDQPTNMANAGTTTPAAKVSGDIKNDALGNPSRFARNASTSVTEDTNSEIDTLRELQLGSNGYQANGYHPRVANSPVPTRGFGESKADVGGYQGE
jgi:hypothetical protein